MAQLGTMILQELQCLRKEVSELKEALDQKGFWESETPDVGDKPIWAIGQTSGVGLDSKITLLLQELRVPANLSGYTYIREAIKMAVEDFSVLNGITYILYPAIAKKFNTTPSKVERCIRHAIESSWHRNEPGSYYLKKFGHTRPTNSQFIAEIADALKMEVTS